MWRSVFATSLLLLASAEGKVGLARLAQSHRFGSRCCRAGEEPAADKKKDASKPDSSEPCIPCSQTDHINPIKCPCPKGSKDKYPGKAFHCVQTRCADAPGDISVMPDRANGMKAAAGPQQSANPLLLLLLAAITRVLA